MNKKITIFIEISIVVIAIIYYVVAIMIPDFQKSQGSSDGFIKTNKYQNLIKIKIDDATDFALVLDSEGKIYHIFFFDNSSVFLYNQNIENKELNSSIKSIITILIENNILKNNSKVEIIHASDEQYNSFNKEWNNILNELKIKTNTSEEVKSLEEIARIYGIETNNVTTTLLELDLYSKEFIKENPKGNKKLDEDTAKSYANKTYMKLEEYVEKEHITNLNKEDVDIPLSLIPIDDIYPTKNSWYYIKDGNVYAYIEFEDDNKYSYCYKGSINNRMEGECQ